MALRGHGGPFAALAPALSLAAILLLTALGLAACGHGDGVGSLLVDPALFSAYHCNDLVKESKDLARRRQQLRDLIDKASEGGGGTVIGAIAYRSDYEAVLERERLVKRAAAEKNCPVLPSYTSDQTIR